MAVDVRRVCEALRRAGQLRWGIGAFHFACGTEVAKSGEERQEERTRRIIAGAKRHAGEDLTCRDFIGEREAVEDWNGLSGGCCGDADEASLNRLFRVLVRPETCLSPEECGRLLDRVFAPARSEDRRKAYRVGLCLGTRSERHAGSRGTSLGAGVGREGVAAGSSARPSSRDE